MIKIELISLLFGMFCIIPEFVQIKRSGIKLKNLVFILFGIIYGIVPFLIYYYKGAKKLYRSYIDFSNIGNERMLLFILLSVLGYFSMQIGYKVLLKTKSFSYQEYEVKELSVAGKNFQITIMIVFLIGVLSLFLWMNTYGGFRYAFLNADDIRTGIIKPTSMAFIKRFALCLFISTYGSLYLFKKKYSPKLNVVIFVLSCVLSLLYCLLNDGRMTMAMYLTTVLMVLFGIFDNANNKKRTFLEIIMLTITMGIFIWIVLNMDNITDYLKYGEKSKGTDKTIMQSILYELDFIYYGGQAAIKNMQNHGQLFMLHDIASSFFGIIPSRLKPSFLIELWNYNTTVLRNIPGGQKPTGLIATSIYDARLFGVIIIPWFWGAVLRNIEKFKNRGEFYLIGYYYITYVLLRMVMYCWLRDSVAMSFNILLTIIIFNFVKYVKK